MPGIHFAFSPSLEPNAATRVPPGLARETDYVVTTAIQDDTLMCVFSSHPGYPLTSHRASDTFIAFEGMVYNMPPGEVDARLRAIADSIVDPPAVAELVRRFIDDTDGEFFALLYDPESRSLVAFNDRWGRLPAYVYRDSDRLVVSRELKFVLPWMPHVEFDPLGVADFLLFEFVPGDGTIIKDVETLAPATCVHARARHGGLDVTVVRVATECLDDPQEPMSRMQCCEHLRDLLLQATTCRVERLQSAGYQLTADLSGGFDSRLVCAALAAIGAPVHLYTDALVTGDESEYAQRVADILKLPLHRIVTPRESTSEDLSAIAVATDCTVNVWTSLASRQDSLARRQLCGPKSVRFLGLGAGSLIKRVPQTKRGYASIGRQMAAGHQVGLGSMNTVSSLTGIPVDSLSEHIDTVLGDYSERTRTGHLKRWHFEYERKLVTYGEDRSRVWIWPTAPLWSRPLYEFVLTQVPERYARGPSGLYYPLLALFGQELAAAPLIHIAPHDGSTPVKRRVIEMISDTARFLTSTCPGGNLGFKAARTLRSRETTITQSQALGTISSVLHEPNLLWNAVDRDALALVNNDLATAHSWRLLTLALYGRCVPELARTSVAWSDTGEATSST